MSILVISYLFLGGIGAGSLVVLIGLDCWLKRRERIFQGYEHLSRVLMWPLHRLVAQGYLVSLVALVLGVVCLLVDLGRLENAFFMFMRPFDSLISAGTYALSILIMLSALLAAAKNIDMPSIPPIILLMAKGCAAVLALFVMVYTGLYLQDIRAVSIWGSWLVPLLFFLSSLSCGIALVFGVAFLVEKNIVVERALGLLAKIDIVLIAVESVVLVAFLLKVLGAPGSLAFDGFFSFMGAEDIPFVFWIGLVLCGLVLPVFVELVVFRKDMHVAGVFVAVLVLIGGFSLRYCIVEAGSFPSMTASALALERHSEVDSDRAGTNTVFLLAEGR